METIDWLNNVGNFTVFVGTQWRQNLTDTKTRCVSYVHVSLKLERKNLCMCVYVRVCVCVFDQVKGRIHYGGIFSCK